MAKPASAPELLPEVCTLLRPYNRHNLPLTAATDFVDDLALDSLTVMELVAEMEDHFDILIPLNRLPEARTVGDFARLLAALRQERVDG
jgi:acyl carrier protein